MIYVIGILSLITLIYFCSIILIVIGFFRLRNKSRLQVDSNSVKNISIIIAARNEEDNILKCLESLQNQNYESVNFEVIIVNDHSTDGTVEAISTFLNKNNLAVSVFDLNDKKSKKEAIKYGVKKANYDIIATTDADCILPENWLKNISSKFNDDIEMLLGPIMFKKGSGFLAGFQTLDMLAIQGIEYGMLNYNQPILNNAANLSYKKRSYLSVNGIDDFETPSGDDVFLLEKFKISNQKIEGLLSKDFIVETNDESSFRGLLNQRLRWASKSKYYSDKMLINTSGIVLLQNLILIFVYIAIPLVEKYSLILIILLFCKWLIDFILLFLVADFFKRKSKLLYFIPVQLVYPIYIVVIWMASMTMNFEWKGRKF